MSDYNYDSARIRREARQLDRYRKRLSSECTPELKSARSRLDERVRGRTADALESKLIQTQKKVTRLDDDLRCIYKALMRYADTLEELDEKLAQAMGK